MAIRPAKLLIAEGAKVYITGRNQASLDKAQASLGPQAIALKSDVSSLHELSALHDRIAGHGDVLDVLFANAGIAENNTFGATDEAFFDKTFDINVKGLFFTVQTMLPLVRDQGSIILNASIVANKGMENLSVYNASKAAVRSFARSWTNDLKSRKIRVNAISPGFTRTPIMEGMGWNEQQIADFAVYASSVVPLGSVAQPEQIARAVAFLASDDADYISGIELTVDGGFAQI